MGKDGRMKWTMLPIFTGVILALATMVAIGMFATEAHVANVSEPETGAAMAVTSDRNRAPSAMTSDIAARTPAGETTIRTACVTLKTGDTLLAVLNDTGISYAEAFAATEAMKPVLDPRRLKVGQQFDLWLRYEDTENSPVHLRRLSFVPETDRRIVVASAGNEEFEAESLTVNHSRRIAFIAGEITTNLYEAGLQKDVPMAILLQAYRTLGHALDFQRDLHAGDSFELGYELFDDGASGGVHPGNLLFASFELSDQTFRIFRYEMRDGYTGFFDQSGRSVETSLMKTPVDGGELSSLFGKRDHPILGFTRMHKGLDFAAPRGAPVLAAGDGVVERRHRNGSFGNYIRLRHDQTYATAYGHLSRYAPALRPGDRVGQSEVIGYVGATGLATGPNLHYEVLMDGKQVNPMTLKLLPLRVLKGDELARFRCATARIIGILNSDPVRLAEGNDPAVIPVEPNSGDNV